MNSYKVRETRSEENKSTICEEILRSLPDWFGIETAILEYIKSVQALPTFVLEHEGRLAGFLSVEFHNQYTAEIHVLGVRPEFHRTGAGRALLEAGESYIRKKGAEYLMVKTLGPSRPNPEYDATRIFYFSVGFRPLEEFKKIWNEDNPCLVMVKKL